MNLMYSPLGQCGLWAASVGESTLGTLIEIGKRIALIFSSKLMQGNVTNGAKEVAVCIYHNSAVKYLFGFLRETIYLSFELHYLDLRLAKVILENRVLRFRRAVLRLQRRQLLFKYAGKRNLFEKV